VLCAKIKSISFFKNVINDTYDKPINSLSISVMILLVFFTECHLHVDSYMWFQGDTWYDTRVFWCHVKLKKIQNNMPKKKKKSSS
jgi:hypothetical protein